MHPLITVVIPTYNQAEFIEYSIKSVLIQSYSPFELIIINDGSTDKTKGILEKYKTDHRLAVIEQNNQGLSAARNLGIKQASGEYIALLDSDDLMTSDRLEKQFQMLKNRPEADVIYTAITVINEKGKKLNTIHREAIPSENFLALEFFRNQVPSPSTLLARKSVFDTHQFDTALRVGEDLEWILRAAHQYNFYYLDRPLTQYRRHQNNISENLDHLRVVELAILRKYGIEHIVDIIDKSMIENKPLLKGKIFYLMEMYPGALKLLEQIDDPLADFYQGNCFYQLNQHQNAIQCYRRSLEKNPNDPACLNNLGISLLKISKKAEAESCFSKALMVKPGYLDPKHRRFTRRELRRDLLPYIPK